MAILRGDIYWIDWTPARGSEQAGIRPALVVQNDVGNRVSSTTIVAAISSQFDRIYPFMVLLEPSRSGLPVASVVNLSQLMTIAQQRLLPPRGENILRSIGRVDYPELADIDRALQISLGL